MARNLLQSICSIVFTLVWQVCLGEICPETAEDQKFKRKKTCPDFKDNPDFVACCPSKINLGIYYCCPVEEKTEIESQIASESRRQFIRENLAVIIICSILSILFLLVLITMICKRLSFCPSYRRKRSPSYHSQHHSQLRSRYRQVEPPPSKPPATYEAPPPYEFHGYASSDIIRREAMQHHDYNCLLENRLNDVRDEI